MNLRFLVGLVAGLSLDLSLILSRACFQQQVDDENVSKTLLSLSSGNHPTLD